MLYYAAANAIALVHFLFILFVIGGGLLVLRWPRLAWLHVPAVVWGVLVITAGWICPLTPLENEMLSRAGREGYQGGFIERYILSLIYPAGLTRSLQILLGSLVAGLNLLVYGGLAFRYGYRRKRGPDARAIPRRAR